MSTSFDYLEWDSGFFGYKIASIKPNEMTLSDLRKILSDLNKDGCRLAYCFVNPEDEISKKSITGVSGILADEKITYSIHDFGKTGYSGTEQIKSYGLSFPSEKLKSLSLQSGLYSRFKIDRGFKNNEFEKLYTEWIRKSADKSLADEILVYSEDNDEKGFITLVVKNNVGSIGLIAVDENERGKSIGRKLINAALAYFNDRNISTVEVVTQKANRTACVFYESLGFKVKSIINIYHLWIS